MQTEVLADGLAGTSVVDVAVVPVQNASGDPEVPLDAARGALYAGLVDRLYSPLRLEYVDRHWGSDPPEPGGGEADALLELEVREWDTSLLGSHRAVRAEAVARLVDARSGAPEAGAEPLWSARVRRRLQPGRQPTREESLRRAAELLALEVLELIPARDPLAPAD